MYINSPGGVVTAGLAIYDTMQYIRCPVATLAVGQVRHLAALASTGALHGLDLAALALTGQEPLVQHITDLPWLRWH